MSRKPKGYERQCNFDLSDATLACVEWQSEHINDVTSSGVGVQSRRENAETERYAVAAWVNPSEGKRQYDKTRK
jgi:hypothetical protein